MNLRDKARRPTLRPTDSRAGRPDLEAEDAYLTRVRFGEDQVAAGSGGTSSLGWAALGGAAALVFAGVVVASLVGVTNKSAGRSRSPL